MRKRQWIGLSVVIAVGVTGALACSAAQAENGRPSREAMEAMGLGSLVVMSDDAAMAVRGQGYRGGGSHVVVSGNSFATYNGGMAGGSHSENAYSAEGKHDAKGSNSSYAGGTDIWIGGQGGGYKNKRNKGPKGSGGGYGGMPGGGQPGGHPGGGKPGGGYGNVMIHTTIFFAGGHSSAWAK